MDYFAKRPRKSITKEGSRTADEEEEEAEDQRWVGAKGLSWWKLGCIVEDAVMVDRTEGCRRVAVVVIAVVVAGALAKHSGPCLVQVSGNNGRDLANGVDTDDVVSAGQLGLFAQQKPVATSNDDGDGTTTVTEQQR